MIDATCPLVAKVHAEARRFAGPGATIVLRRPRRARGGRGHPGRGAGGDPGRRATPTTSTRLQVVRPGAGRVPDADHARGRRGATEIVDALRERFPALRRPAGPTTSATRRTNRQEAVRAGRAECDVVLVVGSRELVQLGPARRGGASGPAARPTWSTTPATSTCAGSPGLAPIGITAGASAPASDWSDELVAALRALGAVDVVERVTPCEDRSASPFPRRCAAVSMPLASTDATSGRYLIAPEARAAQEVPAASSSSSRSSPATSSARAAARSSTPRDPQAADAGRGGARRRRGVRRADGLDRRRRAADAPRDRRDRARSWSSARSSSSSAPTRCCCGRSSTSSSRRRTSRGSCTSTGCASATTRPSARTASSTRRWRRSARPRRAGSASPPTPPSSTPTPRRPSARCSTS